MSRSGTAFASTRSSVPKSNLTAVREEENIDVPKVHDLVVLLYRIEDTVQELGYLFSEGGAAPCPATSLP